MNLAFQFEPAVGSRSRTDNASVTHGVPSLCRLLHGIWSLALLAAGGFIDEGAEDAVQFARLFATGHERPAPGDGPQPRRGSRESLGTRPGAGLVGPLPGGPGWR